MPRSQKAGTTNQDVHATMLVTHVEDWWVDAALPWMHARLPIAMKLPHLIAIPSIVIAALRRNGCAKMTRERAEEFGAA